MMEKRDMRRNIRMLKKQYTEVQLREKSRLVINRLMENESVRKAKTICLYYSLPDEVYTHDLVENLMKAGKEVLLPRVIGEEEMEIRKYTGMQDMTVSAYHIFEPSGELFTAYHDIDVVVVPGMGFDKEGNRLGRGRGYYDRFLCQIPEIYKIGICFDFQIMDKIPTESTDIPVNTVISNVAL